MRRPLEKLYAAVQDAPTVILVDALDEAPTLDAHGSPVQGATVNGTWSDAYTAAVSGITGADDTVW